MKVLKVSAKVLTALVVIVSFFFVKHKVEVGIFEVSNPSNTDSGSDGLGERKQETKSCATSPKDQTAVPFCQEVFSIGFGDSERQLNVSNDLLHDITAPKCGGDPWAYDLEAYDHLGKMIPSILPSRGPSHGYDSTTAELFKNIMSSSRLPWLPCRLHWYSPDQVTTCIRRRHSLGLANSFLFIGDSRIRMIFQALGRLFEELDVSYHLANGTTLDWQRYNRETFPKGHEDQSVTSDLFPDLQMNLRFVTQLGPNLKQEKRGGLQTLRRLTETATKDLPSLVVIGVAAWLLAASISETLRSFEVFHEDIEAVADLVGALAHRTRVVLWLQDGFRTPTHARGEVESTNDKLEFVTKILLDRFRKTSVIVWDSSLPVAARNRRDCQLMEDEYKSYADLYTSLDWFCFDVVHIGYHFLAFHAQVILNHLCNPILVEPQVHLQERFCCT